MYSEPSSGIKLTAYSCICWLFHRIYYDARNHKHKIVETILLSMIFETYSLFHTLEGDLVLSLALGSGQFCTLDT